MSAPERDEELQAWSARFWPALADMVAGIREAQRKHNEALEAGRGAWR